jgi:glycosyltransferase involved in cell wall biosynthesis
MKIGICARTWGEIGGIGVYTRRIVKSLIDIDSHNEYYLYFSRKSDLGNFSQVPNVREFYLPLRGKWMWDQWAVPRAADRENVDIVFHTKFSVPFLSSCKTAMVLHGTERFVFPEHHKKLDMVFFKTIYPQYLKRSDLIIAVSERGRLDIIEKVGIDPGKVKTVHLAASPIFRVIHDEEKLERIRNTYDIFRDYIIYVGHIYPGKNIKRLLQAFAKVRQDHDIDLVIAGALRWKYASEMELISSLNTNGHIHVLGHVPHEDLVGLYNCARLTVFPSFYESFPAIPLEANACGCPVVISRTGGSPEAAGEAALYVDPLDVQSIAQAVSSLLEDPGLHREMIEKGFQNVQRFSWQKTAKETLSALEWAVGQR